MLGDPREGLLLLPQICFSSSQNCLMGLLPSAPDVLMDLAVQIKLEARDCPKCPAKKKNKKYHGLMSNMINWIIMKSDECAFLRCEREEDKPNASEAKIDQSHDFLPVVNRIKRLRGHRTVTSAWEKLICSIT